MRTLKRNAVKLWILSPTAETDYLDSDGFKTGELVKTYGLPVQKSMNIFPFDGKVMETIFGTDTSFDMVGITNDLVLDEHTLLFLQEPIGDYEKTYDYRIDKVLKSLNTTRYGLRKRV